MFKHLCKTVFVSYIMYLYKIKIMTIIFRLNKAISTYILHLFVFLRILLTVCALSYLYHTYEYVYHTCTIPVPYYICVAGGEIFLRRSKRSLKIRTKFIFGQSLWFIGKLHSQKSYFSLNGQLLTPPPS